jgi:hypothetical protein
MFGLNSISNLNKSSAIIVPNISNTFINEYSVIGDIIRVFALYYLLLFVMKKNLKLPIIFLAGMAISFSSISLFAGINGHLIRAASEGISTLVMIYILFLQS